ncbi:MAG: FHA domain-containing protein [Verrucomicrobiales bacterium]|nr:FHA domain-containing protein [Verrucomicrobiales bacterium]
MTLTFQLPGGETLSADLPPGGDFSLGSAEGNDIVLNHPSLHAQHAVFHCQGDTVRLEDTSAETTFSRTLSPGTEIYVGEILVTAGTPKSHAPISVPTSRDDNPQLQRRLKKIAREERASAVRSTTVLIVVLAVLSYAAGFAARYFQG